jgi:two-component system nitrate/nitrite response regulator NarL
MSGRIRIIVMDDHPLLLDGLVATLSADEELEVVATGGDASSAVAAARRLQPELALLDIGMPGGGIEAARTILKAVDRGEVYVAPGLAYVMIKGLTRPRSVDPFEDLTTREREVLELVAAGLSNAEIGGRLGLAEKTVKHYMTAILGKLQVGSRVEAALLAYKAGVRPEADGRDDSQS